MFHLLKSILEMYLCEKAHGWSLLESCGEIDDSDHVQSDGMCQQGQNGIIYINIIIIHIVVE